MYAFWRAVVDQPDHFSSLISNARLDVNEWTRQRELYHTADRNDFLGLGFATFYLNRTNRSGALNGGPIGGKAQTGTYKIDARFNKATLLERVRLIALYARKIDVRNVDGIAVIEEYATQEDALIYADPPYFEKAGSLYLNSFDPDDHVRLASCLNGIRDRRWLLTYDDVPQVGALYGGRRIAPLRLNYSAHRVVKATETLVFSDRLKLDQSLHLFADHSAD